VSRRLVASNEAGLLLSKLAARSRARPRSFSGATISLTNPVLADPEMKFIFAKVGDVSQQIGALIVKGLPGENPTHVRPKAAIARGMRIARLVGELMMDTMRGHPEDRATFQR